LGSMKYFDANTWIGRWPFAFVEDHNPASLAAHLRAHGIGRALVSPLDAVFAPEPGPANYQLLRTTEGVAPLVPVPVINPALANWREELAACATDPRVRAVRLLPRYHNYRLNAPGLNELLAELTRRKLRVIVQVRLIDERHEFHAMNLKPVAVAELQAFLQSHAKVDVLASGLLRAEVLPLAPKHPNLIADLSFAEWHDTIPHLLAKVPARQLAFASHTPFLVTAAARDKLDRAATPTAKRAAIASGNLERFLKP
jgi:predicted TIM-barrel fold metal-dependent hydrolase